MAVVINREQDYVVGVVVSVKISASEEWLENGDETLSALEDRE